ncbi:hypothetical protein VPNG_07131 [Cytospora leucostoma]|uniref:Cytochrome b561 domain-containing protein n=1 Tax=Cytospora leucostoma TaxID=1230097 RepID=A0A423WVA3_9PEZI|nr:hypothetical protein VPNG_07131 [Cytospora leucostoma]
MSTTKTTPPVWLLALLATPATTLLAIPTNAQFGGFTGFGWGNQNPYSGNDSDDDDGDIAGYYYGQSLSSGSGRRTLLIHGILACLAFVILFPLGAILLRLIPGRWSFHAHWVVQMLALVLYIAAFALGVAMVRGIRLPGGGGGFLSNPSTNYHPIIGIIVFILLIIQPLLGIVHHRNFKVLKRRTLSSHLHIWDGRVAIILGIVNGGLGLKLAGAADTVKLAYTIVAAIFGGTWIVLAVLSEFRKQRGRDVLGRRTSEDKPLEVKMVRIQKVGRRRGSDAGSPTRSRHRDNGRYR